MRILGLDVASTTGWSILDNGQLVKYGVLHIPAEMNVFQRMKYFEVELKKILEENAINFCSIEDVILGISGAKTLSYLARLNGVAIISCYNHVNDNIKLYDPTQWKSSSFEGMNGHATKVDIQIAVCKHFHLISDSDLNVLTEPLRHVAEAETTIKTRIKELTIEKQKTKQLLARKRGGLKTEDEIKYHTDLLSSYDPKIFAFKQAMKNSEKGSSIAHRNVSTSIAAKCGITADVADSIGLAYCAHKQLT